MWRLWWQLRARLHSSIQIAVSLVSTSRSQHRHLSRIIWRINNQQVHRIISSWHPQRLWGHLASRQRNCQSVTHLIRSLVAQLKALSKFRNPWFTNPRQELTKVRVWLAWRSLVISNTCTTINLYITVIQPYNQASATRKEYRRRRWEALTTRQLHMQIMYQSLCKTREQPKAKIQILGVEM